MADGSHDPTEPARQVNDDPPGLPSSRPDDITPSAVPGPHHPARTTADSAATRPLPEVMLAAPDLRESTVVIHEPQDRADGVTAATQRRWPKVVAGFVIVALGIGAAVLGWLANENAQKARDWEDLAIATQDRLDDTTDTLAASEADLDEARGEIDSLEERVADLAAEKSQVATEREFFQTQQELFAGVALFGDSAISSMTGCLGAQGDVTSAVFDLDPGSYLFYTYLDIYTDVADRARAVCSSAIDDVNEFRGALDELLAAL